MHREEIINEMVFELFFLFFYSLVCIENKWFKFSDMIRFQSGWLIMCKPQYLQNGAKLRRYFPYLILSDIPYLLGVMNHFNERLIFIYFKFWNFASILGATQECQLFLKFSFHCTSSLQDSFKLCGL